MDFSLGAIASQIAEGFVLAHDHGTHTAHGHGAHGGGMMSPSPPPSAPNMASSGVALTSKEYDAYLSDMHVGMEKMMTDMHADPPSGDPDIDFLVMMVPHHWGGVEMARLVLRDGRDPLVREIAEKIIAGQLTEMEGMRGRLEALRQGRDEYPSLTGNRGP